MDSAIHVESAPGKGSVFWFDLVLGVAHDATSATALPAPAAPLASALAPCGADEAAAALIPPAAEIETLHQLALAGNMRTIIDHAAHLLTLDQRYRHFVDQLNALARNYQTRALLQWIEAYKTGTRAA